MMESLKWQPETKILNSVLYWQGHSMIRFVFEKYYFDVEKGEDQRQVSRTSAVLRGEISQSGDDKEEGSFDRFWGRGLTSQ